MFVVHVFVVGQLLLFVVVCYLVLCVACYVVVVRCCLCSLSFVVVGWCSKLLPCLYSLCSLVGVRCLLFVAC